MSKVTSLKILNPEGQVVKDFSLPVTVLEQPIKSAVVHQVTVAYAANRRAGTAHVKTRGEVRGGGKKPWRQKGTGRARHGSIRSPLWVGGGSVFGPRSDRNYQQRLPLALKKQAKAMVVADYFTAGKIIIVTELPQTEKTKVFFQMLKDLKISGRRTLILLTEKEKNLRRACNNLPGVEAMAVKELNAYDGLRYPRWLLSQEGADQLIKLAY